MGHGASTNTKKFKIEANDVIPSNDVVWNRSNSDGCIVETLNSSRTKVDLLEQQVDEYKDLLQLAGENYGKAQREADRYNKLLSETESTKLELMDRMEDLEDEINNLSSQLESNSSQELSRIIQGKDQEIESLRANMEKLSRDIKIVKSKCKERLKAMKYKLVESKQDYAMQLYQMKEELRLMKEESKNLSENIMHSSTTIVSDKPGSTHTEDEFHCDPRNQLIIELSNEVSQQEIIILELKEKLRVKNDLSMSVSSLSGTDGKTKYVQGTTSMSHDGCDSLRDTDEQHSRGSSPRGRTSNGRHSKGSSSRGKTSRQKSGICSDSNISQRFKNIDLEAESYNSVRSPGLVSALKSTSSNCRKEEDRLFSRPEDRNRLTKLTLNGHLDGGSPWTDRDATVDDHSTVDVHSANSLHRSKKHQNKLRNLSPLVGINNESLPGSLMNIDDVVTSSDLL